MYAVISDIHSNFVALTAVLQDIQNQGVKDVICLGDIVGYGPTPERCIDAAMDVFKVSIMGNHEWAVLNDPIAFNSIAKKAIEWHQQELKPGLLSPAIKKARWKFLQDLPGSYEQDGFLFVHASPNSFIEEYLLSSDVDEMVGEYSKKLKKAFKATHWACFIGHTHTPGVFFEDKPHFYTPQELGFSFVIEKGRKTIVNIGAVGQPRDGEPTSCYVLVDGNKVMYRRVLYDMKKVCKKILKHEFLDDKLGTRLLEGR